MASSFSDLLRLEQMTQGEQDNTWGDKTTDNLDKLEEAIAGTKAIALAAADVTLSTNNGGDGTSEQAAAMILNCTGVLSASISLIAPNVSKVYIVKNATTGAFTVDIKTPTGTVPLVIPQGETTVVWNDPTADSAKGTFFTINSLVSGTVALATNALQLGGVVAANYAQKALKNSWANPQIVTGNDRALTTLAYTPDVDTDSTIFIAQSELTGAITMNNPTGTPEKGQILTFQIEQHGATPVSITWDTEYIFVDDVSPDLTQTIDTVDVFTFQYNSNLARWVGAGAAQNFPRS